MLIYIIEDDSLKAERLEDFLRDHYFEVEIRSFMSFNSGLKAIGSHLPDIVVLDMTLPTFDRSSVNREGRIRPLGGYDLMRKLELHRINVRAIVVTQLDVFGEGEDQMSFSEIDEKCRLELPRIYAAGIYFDQANLAWQTELIDAIEKVVKEAC